MLGAEQVEELIELVGNLDRDTLIVQFHSYRATFPLDFTDAFLATITVDRLRHLFIAICLQSQQMPTLPAAAEAA